MNSENLNIDNSQNNSISRFCSIYNFNLLFLYIAIDIYIIGSLLHLVLKVYGVESLNSYILLLLGLILYLTFFIFLKFFLELKHYSVLLSNNIIRIPILELFLPILLLSLHILIFFLLISDVIHYTIFIFSLITITIVVSWYMLLLSTIYIEYLDQNQMNLTSITQSIKKLKTHSKNDVSMLITSLGVLILIFIMANPVLHPSIIIFGILVVLRFIYWHRQINRYIKQLELISMKNGTLADANIKKIHWS
jgi:hypothetical protein